MKMNPFKTHMGFVMLAALVYTVIPMGCVASGDEQDVEFKLLFEGKTLDGWTRRGGQAEYRVEDGCIVGRTVPRTPNTFLCTDKHYGDFLLEYEFKVDERLNSGVQIRSNSLESYRNGRVHGYQVEIDPDVKRGRLWTAGIYDEARRGWLDDLADNEAARKAFRPDEWNHVRVEAVGDSIRTWLNRVPAADLVDSETLSGFIGLQVHGIGDRQDGPFEVRWRNLRIKDLGRHVWKPIFDGKSLDGWTPLVEGTWRVEDGMLVGRSAAREKRHGILLSKQRFKDFTVRVVYKAIQGNSGLYFRAEPVEGDAGVHGFQAEIDPKGSAGGLYETGGRGWVVQPAAEEAAKWYRPNDWNEMTVSALGRRIVVHVNGQRTAELENDPGRLEGHLGLQLHGGQDMHVQIKRVELLVKEP
jgi:hypothetical protein